VKTWDGFGYVLVGLCQSGLGYESVTVRLRDAIEGVTFEEMSLIPCLLID
jgi:hypothetical protein